MGRLIALGPGGRAQAPVRDDRARAVIEFVRDAGMLDQLLLSPVCATREQADDLRLALYRSAFYYCSCQEPQCIRKFKNYPPHNGCPGGGQRISCSASVVSVTDASGAKRYAVQFRFMDKREAMRAVVQKYGPDPNAWPYFAKRKTLSAKDLPEPEPSAGELDLIEENRRLRAELARRSPKEK